MRIHFKPLGKNEWLLGNKRSISFLLGVVNSTQHIAEQIGWASPEGHQVLGDALLCFWILLFVITSCIKCATLLLLSSTFLALNDKDGNQGPFERVIFFKLINCCPIHSLNQTIFICLSPIYKRVRKNKSCTP